MLNKQNITLLFSLCVLTFSCNTKSTTHKKLPTTGKERTISLKEVNDIFDKATRHLNNAWPKVEKEGKLPRSIEKGYRDIDDWTSGFYPGNLWLVYEQTNDKSLMGKARYATELLEEEKYNVDDHDIGFRIYCSYGRAYKITGDSKYKDVIVQAAESAIQRYNPKVQAIMSWNPNQKREWQYPVIIDNMMNLELLFAASKFTGNRKYHDIALNHANTTMKFQYREDHSCSHVIDFDSITGKFRKRDWNNGNNDPNTAAWSRGQSWGLYGYTMMYRETKAPQYLEHAENIASFLLHHPNMPKDMVPYWDYHAPEIPTLRDASAGAIMASALIELSQYSKKNGKKYFAAGEKILKSLASPEYLAEPGSNGNFLLKHATGNYLKESERDGTLIYADYYFLEGLQRYIKLKNI